MDLLICRAPVRKVSSDFDMTTGQSVFDTITNKGTHRPQITDVFVCSEKPILFRVCVVWLAHLAYSRPTIQLRILHGRILHSRLRHLYPTPTV